MRAPESLCCVLKKDTYNAFNVYRRELAPGTISLTGDRAQGDDSKHWAYSNPLLSVVRIMFTIVALGPVTC